MDIKWIEKENEIIFSSVTAHALSINMSKAFLKIGQWEKEFKISEDDSFPSESIGLPEMINQIFSLPSNLNYEVKISGRTIMLGPVIGMIASEKHMTPNKLNKFLSRFKDYQALNGLVYIFSTSGVNKATQTIKGYYYNPNGDNSVFWEEGIFPYPGALYKRIPIKKGIYEHLKSVIGEEQIFNSYHFNKWELWKLLPKSSQSKCFLPYTERFSQFEQLDHFTKTFETVYLKPQSGSGGIGIQCIQKCENSFKLISHDNDVEIVQKIEDLWEKVKHLTHNGYLIQQGINAECKDQHVDFRAYMQKNQLKEWDCKLLITRFSKKNEISTNLKYLDHLCVGNEGICKLFQVNKEEAIPLENIMKDACIRLCKDLDMYIGHYGDLAIDLMIDRNKNIWIIEVNTKTYGYTSFRKLNNVEMFYSCKTTPFQYAKALSGF